MKCPSPAVVVPAWLVFLFVVAGMPLPGAAQRAQSPLEIGEMTHTTANDRSIIVIVVFNSGTVTLDATGEFTLVGPSGSELARTTVQTGRIGPDEAGVVAVPFSSELEAGLYTATLTLEDREADVLVTSGLREMAVRTEAIPATPTVSPAPPTAVPVASEEESGSGGFPSWLLLIIGLSVTVLGVTYMRTASTPRKSTARPVPAVSMVRKVKVNTPPPRRAATIKPLIPPRRMEPD